MKFDKLMQYQKCDAQAIKLERKLGDSEHKKIYSQMLAVVKDAKSHTAALENQAGNLLHSYNQLKNKYKENCDLLDKLTKVDLDKESAENVDKIFEKIAVISNNLNALEKKLMTVAEQKRDMVQQETNITNKKQCMKKKRPTSNLNLIKFILN